MKRETIILAAGIALTAAVLLIIGGFFWSGTVRRLRKAEKELAETRSRLLLSGIRSHFLFNMLNSIYELCGRDPEKARETTGVFADYLRGNLNLSGRTEPVPFEAELAQLRQYAALQSVRFGDRIHLVCRIGTSDFCLPAFTLQPLAENAIKHGRKSPDGEITICVQTEETADGFSVKVQDDGAGFDAEKFFSAPRDPAHSGIALVRERLSAGCRGSLSVTSRPGKGTTAVINIPKKYKYSGGGVYLTMEILAVDDEELALLRMEDAIHGALPQATVHLFRNPDEALQCMRRYRIETAFLDIELQGEMQGIELARRLKEINPCINIIFTTAWNRYMGDAFTLHASGYILKPVTTEKVRFELANLRNPVPARPSGRLVVQCFGNFEIFCGGEPVAFRYSKAKELFAYLVDRKGASVNGNELCAVLWEEDHAKKSTLSYLRNIYSSLKSTFDGLGVGDVLVKNWNAYSVRRDAFWCDYYEFLKGNVSVINSFHNEYMSQYSWAEFRLGEMMEHPEAAAQRGKTPAYYV